MQRAKGKLAATLECFGIATCLPKSFIHGFQTSSDKGDLMRGPYGLELNDGCKTCKLKAAGFFCQLPPAALKDFDAIKSTSTYPKGALLFMEGQDARGVFVLCEGDVKLSISSSEGKTLNMRVAKAGEILGLVAGISGAPYEVTAETVRPCRVAFVRCGDFQRFVAKYPEVSQGVARQMSMEYQAACEQLHTLGLSLSAQEKLARLLLTWSAGIQQTKEGTHIKLPLTHEEIAEFIGTTRETVTRTLSEFKVRHLVAIQGSKMTIPNRAALESYAHV
jgi:CRP/FNR family cyclic AMP-dependent transcriptional regulator